MKSLAALLSRRRSTVPFFVIFAGLAVACQPQLTAAADEAKASTLELKTERVIVFKDGYALVIKRGAARTNDQGQLFLHDVPDAAVLGSFWATPSEGRLINMVAGWSELDSEESKKVGCIQTIEVLQANVGKKATLHLNDATVLNGTILSVLTRETSQPVDASLSEALGIASSSALLRSRTAATNSTETITGISGTYFVLRVDDGDVLIATSDVRRLIVEDMQTELVRTIKKSERTKRLTFRFEAPGQQRELLIAYFRPGFRWIPTYRVNLAENGGANKRAEVSMQAELLNEAEDLHDTPIDIVVGVPNFRFRDTPSPLVLESVLRNTIQQAAPQLRQQLSNFTNSAYATQSFADRRAAANGEGTPINLPGELTATGSQDLFVYNLPKLDLKKGERAAIPIFSTTVGYRDVFTWDLHVQRNDIAAAPSGSGVDSPLQLARNKIWRQIELINSTNVPWTTGAAMIMQGQQPLAQELLTYTSPGDECRVPVTVAVDVRGTHNEEETGRKLASLRWRNNEYAKIDQRAMLNVCNHKAETIDLEITMRFGGKATAASHDGRITLLPFRDEDWTNYNGDRAVNNSSTVYWRTKLTAGQLFEPTTDFFFYTRH